MRRHAYATVNLAAGLTPAWSASSEGLARLSDGRLDAYAQLSVETAEGGGYADSLEVDLGAAKSINVVALLGHNFHLAPGAGFEVYGSANGSDWLLIKERTTPSGVDTALCFEAAGYRYFRLWVVADESYTGYATEVFVGFATPTTRAVAYGQSRREGYRVGRFRADTGDAQVWLLGGPGLEVELPFLDISEEETAVSLSPNVLLQDNPAKVAEGLAELERRCTYQVPSNEPYANMGEAILFQSYSPVEVRLTGIDFYTLVNYPLQPGEVFEGTSENVGFRNDPDGGAVPPEVFVSGVDQWPLSGGFRTGIEAKLYAKTDIEYLQETLPVPTNGIVTFTTTSAGLQIVRLIKTANGATLALDAESTGTRYYLQLAAESYAVTDAEYLQETLPIPDTNVVTFSAGAPGLALVRLRNLSTGNTLAYRSQPTNRVRSFDFPLTDLAYNQFRNRNYTYDQAIYLLAVLASGDMGRADEVAQGLIDSQIATVGPVEGAWPFSCNLMSGVGDAYVRNGGVAWCLYSMARYMAARGGSAVSGTDACVDAAATYLETQVSSTGIQTGLVTGGRGRYVGDVFDADYVIPWAATEHNLDAHAAFLWADEALGVSTWAATAEGISDALDDTLWNEGGGYFYQGASDSSTLDTASALDCMTWGAYYLMSKGRLAEARASLARANLYYRFVVAGVTGYAPYSTVDGYPSAQPTVWTEGTLGAASAFFRVGDVAAYVAGVEEVDKLRVDGKLPYANVAVPAYEIASYDAAIGVAWDVWVRCEPASPLSLPNEALLFSPDETPQASKQQDDVTAMWMAAKAGAMLWVPLWLPSPVAAQAAEQECLLGRLSESMTWRYTDYQHADADGLVLTRLPRGAGQ